MSSHWVVGRSAGRNLRPTRGDSREFRFPTARTRLSNFGCKWNSSCLVQDQISFLPHVLFFAAHAIWLEMEFVSTMSITEHQWTNAVQLDPSFEHHDDVILALKVQSIRTEMNFVALDATEDEQKQEKSKFSRIQHTHRLRCMHNRGKASRETGNAVGFSDDFSISFQSLSLKASSHTRTKGTGRRRGCLAQRSRSSVDTRRSRSHFCNRMEGPLVWA